MLWTCDYSWTWNGEEKPTSQYVSYSNIKAYKRTMPIFLCPQNLQTRRHTIEMQSNYYHQACDYFEKFKRLFLLKRYWHLHPWKSASNLQVKMWTISFFNNKKYSTSKFNLNGSVRSLGTQIMLTITLYRVFGYNVTSMVLRVSIDGSNAEYG